MMTVGDLYDAVHTYLFIAGRARTDRVVLARGTGLTAFFALDRVRPGSCWDDPGRGVRVALDDPETGKQAVHPERCLVLLPPRPA